MKIKKMQIWACGQKRRTGDAEAAWGVGEQVCPLDEGERRVSFPDSPKKLNDSKKKGEEETSKNKGMPATAGSRSVNWMEGGEKKRGISMTIPVEKEEKKEPHLRRRKTTRTDPKKQK